ncbi:phage tail sheath C-terminal domain-containing protein [Fluviicola sp.]|uniref:phage tail sheath family protein n=1 Tax=Fluviicola sp. TaxID=1917219 RepID=UPI002623ADCF|nr:phage tail sheath C-terminal domain-containing protein [Fluviicola sp.]
MKTPGVYVVEKNAFPNSVVEAATAVPAFIGYTKFAKDGNKSLLNKPWKISSMAEFVQYFGGPPVPKYAVAEAKGDEGDDPKLGISTLEINGKKYTVQRNDKYNFYYQMRFFFANGGGTCYIVSVDEGYTADLSEEKLTDGITKLLKEEEPTMVLVPEAVYLDTVDSCSNVQVAALRHCGGDMANRVAIFDVFDGFKDDNTNVNNFREKILTEFLDYGAVYYPWLNTSIVPDTDITFLNFEDPTAVAAILTENDKDAKLTDFIASVIKKPEDLNTLEIETTHKVLARHSSAYSELMREMILIVNMLPPSTAMAGIYTLVDATKEVWKAPANIGVANVISPTVSISFKDQEDLNVPMNGKAVNAIRYFVGEGVKVWGARTLDGNSLDWRYINVRRTMIMLEESIKNAAKAYVFEPNVANTWVSVKSMITNFLNGIWKRGGLAGASPEDAFSVHIGLGDTMTPEDILEGIMRITILVAISRPAEFIEITFQQQMQKS